MKWSGSEPAGISTAFRGMFDIAGGLTQAYYGGVPIEIRDRAVQELDEPLRAILEEFEARFPHPARPKGADLPGMGHDRPPQDQGI